MGKKNFLLGGVFAVASMFGSLGGAQADGSASYTIHITGYVPVICHVAMNATEVSATPTVDLGSVSEFCNNPTGYQVWADYTPGISSATINVDGHSIALSPNGSTMIASSNTAAMLTRHLSLTGGTQMTTLSLRIVPI